MNSINEVALIDRAVAGDTRALQCLMLRYHAAVREVISRDFPSELCRISDPDDILQLTWIDVANSMDRFQTQRETGLFTWICTIAKRNCTDLVRFHRAAKRGGGALAIELTHSGTNDETNQSLDQLIDFALDQSPTPSRAVSGQEALAALLLAIETLSPEHRQVIQLRYLECHPVADVAQQMNRSERAIHGLCYRASQELRSAMGRYSRFFTSV